MYKAILVALIVFASYGMSDAATVRFDPSYGTLVNMDFGDTIAINPKDIRGDIIIECSYNNQPEERASLFLPTSLVPKHTFSVYCGERDDTIVIGINPGSGK